MRSAVSAEQWGALRELREGAEPTLPRLAAAAQISVFSLRNQAFRHRWGNYLLLEADAVAAARDVRDEKDFDAAVADGTIDALTDDAALPPAPAPAPEKAQAAGAPGEVRAAGVAAAQAGEVPGAAGATPPPAGTPEERLARVSDMLMAEVEAIGALAQARGRMPDKARIEAVGAMIRLLEKVEEFALSRKGEAGKSRDGEKADVLERIDARIEELARAYAKELGARQPDGRPGGADPG